MRSVRLAILGVIGLVIVGFVALKSDYLADLILQWRDREQQENDEGRLDGDSGGDLEWLSLFAEGEPAFTDDQVRLWVEEILPLVEQETGRRFLTEPQVQTVDRHALQQALERDLQGQMAVLMPEAPEYQQAAMAEQTAQMLAIAALGKYGFVDKCLYLAPGNMQPLLDLAGVDPDLTEPLAKLIVAHELTHALQDQHADIGRLIDETRDIEAMQALNATIEGHAVFVQDRVGRRLGLDEAVLELSRLLSAGAVEFDDPSLQLMNQFLAGQYEQIYLSGRTFIEHHFDEGGDERVWEIVSAPPPDTRVIYQPERYGEEMRAPIDYAALVGGLQPMFGDGRWTAQNQHMGRMILTSLYRAAIPEHADEIVQWIDHAQALVLTDVESGAITGVTLFVLGEPHRAEELIGLLEAAAQTNLQRMSEGAYAAIESFEMETLDEIESDAAHEFRLMMRQSGTQMSRQVIIRVARGSVMIEFMDIGAGLERETYLEIAEELFRRVEEAMKEDGRAMAPPAHHVIARLPAHSCQAA